MRLELTRAGLLVYLANRYTTRGAPVEGGIVIYKALCFDVAQDRMNGAPNETRTHSCRFASLLTVTPLEWPGRSRYKFFVVFFPLNSHQIAY